MQQWVMWLVWHVLRFYRIWLRWGRNAQHAKLFCDSVNNFIPVKGSSIRKRWIILKSSWNSISRLDVFMGDGDILNKIHFCCCRVSKNAISIACCVPRGKKLADKQNFTNAPHEESSAMMWLWRGAQIANPSCWMGAASLRSCLSISFSPGAFFAPFAFLNAAVMKWKFEV